MTPMPRAVRRFGYAAAEHRAARTRRALDAPYGDAPRREGPVRLRLWLPLTPLFVLLAPFALLLALMGYFVPRRMGIDPIRAALGVGALLMALGGTDVDVAAPGADIRIKIF